MTSPAPISVFSFFVELRRRLPIDHGRPILMYGERTPGWVGWTGEMIAALLTSESPPPMPAEVAPNTRIVVRGVQLRTEAPGVAADIAFDDWVSAGLTDRQIEHRHHIMEGAAHHGLLEHRTVVALSRYIPQAEHPVAAQLTVGWVLEAFRVALADLNQLLVQVGGAARSLSVGPISPRDLPAMLPMLCSSSHPAPNGRPYSINFAVPLHDDFPVVDDGEQLTQRAEHEQNVLKEALARHAAANHGEQPFMLTFRLLASAFNERIVGDPTRAIIDLATAIETLASQLLATGGSMRGWDLERVARARRAPWANRVEYHLAALLDVTIDVTNEQSAWGRWWKTGYAARNRIVHDGAEASHEETEAAWAAASGVYASLHTLTRLHPELQPIADMLDAWNIGGIPPWLSEPLPVQLPWCA